MTVQLSMLAVADASSEKIVDVCEIAPVWSGMPVGFDLYTYGERQFVAFYGSDRQMTIAARSLDSTDWRFVRLPQTLGWDSHNSVTLALDAHGYLHVAGNMHCDPLVYFRSDQPYDINSLRRVMSMTGVRERHVTYPLFMTGPNGEFIFTYRDGMSGNGNQIYNCYDPDTQIWTRLLDTDLTDGEGMRNAYLEGPLLGPDGYYHLAWVWRETPSCETNHDVCYARSRDLRVWENSDGQRLVLPITLASGEIVDPIPAGGGLINGNVKIGFDADHRVLLSYHAYDIHGYTQIVTARRERTGWQRYQTTDWHSRWQFSGVGTIHFEVRVFPVCLDAQGRLTQRYSHDYYGDGVWLLDPNTLTPMDEIQGGGIPEQLLEVEMDFLGMEVKFAGDSGEKAGPNTRYILRWETLPENRDQAFEGLYPMPSMLRIYKLIGNY